MTRETIQHLLREAKTLEACQRAEQALVAYLLAHPEDEGLLGEGESLYMKKAALEQLAAQSHIAPPIEHRVAS